MDLTIIRIHVKKILTGNFVFMSLVAIIFGILTLFSKGQEKIIGSYTYIDMLWKGYIFLYIIFACELSKDLLQMEKITRRIEWLIANGTRLQSVYCKIELPKVANGNWRMLHLQIGESCKAFARNSQERCSA